MLAVVVEVEVAVNCGFSTKYQWRWQLWWQLRWQFSAHSVGLHFNLASLIQWPAGYGVV